MPLSEHEQRQLEQIEQALYAEHPRFAKAVRAADPQVHYKRRVVYAALGFVLGIGMLVAGVSLRGGSSYIVISVIGFVVMLSCCMWFVSSYRRMTGITTGRVSIRDRRGRGDKRGRKRSGTGLSERLEERWRRRQEGRGS